MAKKKKKKRSKLDFAQELANKLRALGIGEVNEDQHGDDSGRWVSIKIGDKELSFSFDMAGERLDRLGLYKDVIGVTGSERMFGN